MKAAIAALIISLSLSTVANAQVSCEQVGNSTYCDDGQHFQHNQGNSSQHQGNFPYGSDGSTYLRYNNFPDGNFTYGSNGAPCQRIGHFTYCSN
jgi:hypothetical protein